MGYKGQEKEEHGLSCRFQPAGTGLMVESLFEIGNQQRVVLVLLNVNKYFSDC